MQTMPKTPMQAKAKRSLNSYMKFCELNHPKVKRNNPTFMPSDIVRELAFQWRNLEDRKHYIELAKKDRLRYAETKKTTQKKTKKKIQKKTQKKTQKKIRKKSRAKKRRPCNPYILFCKAHLPGIKLACPELTLNEQIRDIADAWRSLPDRSYYQDLARQHRRQYQEQSRNSMQSSPQKNLLEEEKLRIPENPGHTTAVEAKTSHTSAFKENFHLKASPFKGENDLFFCSSGADLNIDHSFFDIPCTTNDFDHVFSQFTHSLGMHV